MMNTVLVLDKHGTNHQHVSVRHAIGMLFREVAEYVDADHTRRVGPYPWPLILRLKEYVRNAARYIPSGEQPYSKRALTILHEGRCAYCDEPGANTVDHIYPQSKGGKTEWMNVTLACRDCNGRKADKLLSECGMTLLRAPRVPTAAEIYVAALLMGEGLLV